MNPSPHDADWLIKARAAYMQSAPGKIADLAAAIAALESNPSDQESRRRLHTLLHNLIGSGASYGFPAISVIARRLSSALKRATDDRMIIESGLVGILRNGLEELREAFERESTSSDSP